MCSSDSWIYLGSKNMGHGKSFVKTEKSPVTVITGIWLTANSACLSHTCRCTVSLQPEMGYFRSDVVFDTMNEAKERCMKDYSILHVRRVEQWN